MIIFKGLKDVVGNNKNRYMNESVPGVVLKQHCSFVCFFFSTASFLAMKGTSGFNFVVLTYALY